MKNYKPWYETYWNRLEEEEKLLSELNFSLDEEQRVKFNRIVFRGKIVVKKQEYPLILVYPSGFPQFRIEIISSKTNFPRHQSWINGNLCLLPHGQDGWDESIRGVDMLQQAIRLIEDSLEGSDIVAANEVDAPEPWSLFVPFGPSNLLIPPGLPRSIPEGSFGSFIMGDLGYTYVLIKIINQHSNHKGEYALESIPIMANTKQTNHGFWVKVSTTPPSLNPRELCSWLIREAPGTKDTLLGLATGIKTRRASPDLIAIIYPEENTSRNNYNDSWLAGFVQKGDWLKPHYLDPNLWFERNPNLMELRNKKVMILGLGSIGSSIALELAKGGVGSLFLIDREGIEVGNLVRHAANIHYLGRSKVNAVANLVQLQNPFIKIEGLNASIGMTDDLSLTHKDLLSDVYEQMKKCDLIIDCMAHEGATHLVNRMAVDLEIPVIHTWITNGAWGGRVLRTIPHITGCYYCFSKQNVPEISSDPTTGEIFPRGCGFPTFTGASFDILSVVAATTRLSVQTLLNGIGYPNSNHDHICVENLGIPIDKYPSVRSFKVQRNTQCPICGDRNGS